MREYKTKPTALKHIRAGENFTNKVFNRYWTDREVCMEAIAHDPSRFVFVCYHIRGIEWNSEFMESLFLRMLEVKPKNFYVGQIGPYLPPEITDSKEVALRALEHKSSAFENYMAPNLCLDMEVRKKYDGRDYRERKPISSASASLLGERTDVLEDLVKANPYFYWSLPDHLRKLRGVAAFICTDTNTFRLAFDGLHDDEEFVLEVLKVTGLDSRRLLQECSYRIRKAARGKDFINYLETVVQAKQLDALLPRKTGVVEPKAKRLKV